MVQATDGNTNQSQDHNILIAKTITVVVYENSKELRDKKQFRGFVSCLHEPHKNTPTPYIDLIYIPAVADNKFHLSHEFQNILQAK